MRLQIFQLPTASRFIRQGTPRCSETSNQLICGSAVLAVPSKQPPGRRSGFLLPEITPFGLLRVFSVVLPFLYVGTQISKNFAALLEEHDIFVPEDDDDDD
uniref:Essential MCU regulator, mitochondrial n=1 Tax=Anas zonorhyncha TaxID=75864 RepID=A0A8B9U747_9AVES